MKKIFNFIMMVCLTWLFAPLIVVCLIAFLLIMLVSYMPKVEEAFAVPLWVWINKHYDERPRGSWTLKQRLCVALAGWASWILWIVIYHIIF